MIQETIAYKVKPERLDDFRKIRADLQEKVQSAPGFVSSGIEVSVDDETVFLDLTRWESYAHMEEFNKEFRRLDYGAGLKPCIDGSPLFMGCFEDTGAAR